MIDLGALPPGNISQGNGINSGGFVCGMTIVEGAVAHAVFVNAILTMTDIGTLGGEFSYAWDINDQGVITGEASTLAGEVHSFRWTSAGGMIDLGTLGGPRSVGRSINEGGQIAGESQTRNGATRAFRFTEGVGMIDLGTLGGSKSSAYGINDAGQVVGESDTGFVIETDTIVQGFTLFGTHAFLWTAGSAMLDLGHLGGGDSRAEAVNNHGVVVGGSELPNGTSHAFRWTSGEGMIDLNTLLPSGSGWVLISAYDVNDKGQITGDGRLNGQERAFRLNPQPAPSN
jgi:probable HAF family extracellular repeat protein